MYLMAFTTDELPIEIQQGELITPYRPPIYRSAGKPRSNLLDQGIAESADDPRRHADKLGLAMRSLSLMTVVMWVMVPLDLTALV